MRLIIKSYNKSLRLPQIASMIGLALGVAVLIIATSVTNGLKDAMLRNILGINGHLTIVTNASHKPIDKVLADKIKHLSSNHEILIEKQCMIMANAMAEGARCYGIDDDVLKRKKIIADNIKKGTVQLAKHQIIIGAKLAKKLGLNIGSSIKIVAPELDVTIMGSVPRIKAYEVCGIFEIGMEVYDAHTIFMHIDEAKKFFQSLPTDLTLFFDDYNDIEKYTKEIADIVGNDYEILDFKKLNSHFLKMMTVQKNVIFIILSLLVISSLFFNVASMMMLVRDKMADIAILKTMGASKGIITRIFFIFTVRHSIISCIIGAISGIIISHYIDNIRRFIEWLFDCQLFPQEIYLFSSLNSLIDWKEFAYIIIGTIITSIIASLFPARRAASLNPVCVLRNG